jgi:TPR repeat protein
MTNLGVMYDNGYGVSQDDAKAIELYRRGGRSGATDAQTIVKESGFFFDPRLTPVNRETANPEAVSTPARRGDPIAMFLLGYLYSGTGKVDPDFVQAASWYRKSAERGLPAAMANLGLLYIRGLGVPQDHVFGYMWISQAAAAGLTEAADVRDTIAASLGADLLNEARQLTLERWPAEKN